MVNVSRHRRRWLQCRPAGRPAGDAMGHGGARLPGGAADGACTVMPEMPRLRRSHAALDPGHLQQCKAHCERASQALNSAQGVDVDAQPVAAAPSSTGAPPSTPCRWAARSSRASAPARHRRAHRRCTSRCGSFATRRAAGDRSCVSGRRRAASWFAMKDSPCSYSRFARSPAIAGSWGRSPRVRPVPAAARAGRPELRRSHPPGARAGAGAAGAAKCTWPARGRCRAAAATLPDPRLIVGVDNLPVTGPDRYSA